MKKLYPVLLLQFVNGLSFSLFIPVLPFLVAEYGQGEIFYGLLLSSFSICQFFAAPLFGVLSDHRGRRKLLIWSQAGTLISIGLFALALGLTSSPLRGLAGVLRGVLASRIIDGITGGNVGIANAYLADVTTKDEKTKSYGLMGAMIGTAMIIWPALWSRSLDRGRWYYGPLIIAGGISTITLVLLLFKLPESLAPNKRLPWLPATHEMLQFWKRFHLLREYPQLIKWFGLYALFGFMFISYTSTVVFYFKDSLLLSPQQIGLVFGVIWIFLIFHMSITVRILSKKISDAQMFLVWMLLCGVSFVGFAREPNVWMFCGLAFFIDAAFALQMSAFKGLITKQVSETQQGRITGLDESVMAGNRAITPLIASSLFARLGVINYVYCGIILVAIASYLLIQQLRLHHRFT